MILPRWLSSRTRTSQPRRRPPARLRLEALEQRTAPAVFTVNTFDDTVEAERTGSGLDANGNISLRSAIMAANDLGGAHTIQLGRGTYSLSLPPADSNGDDSGNLNVGRGVTQVELTIQGDSADATVINGNYLDQVLSVGFFTTVTVRGLAIENGLGGFGGAVTNSGRVTLENVGLRASTGSHGGGLFNGGTATLTNSIVTGNWAGQGGGVHSGGTLTVLTSTITGNYASQGGGLFNAGTLNLSRSTIHSNLADLVIGQGGGLFNMGTMTLTNATIGHNATAQGGGVFTFGSGPVNLTNTTIAFNYAATGGGGLARGLGDQEIRLKNTLIGLNFTSGDGFDILGQVTSLGHNLISFGVGGTGYASTDIVGNEQEYIDPMLGPLQDNGGPTLTMALQEGSRAIDAGDSEGAPTIDQRGEQRDARVDIGAFEFLP